MGRDFDADVMFGGISDQAAVPGRRAGPEHGAGRRLALLLRAAYGAVIEAAVRKAGQADALEPPLEAAEWDVMLRAGPDDRSDNPYNTAGE